MQQDTRFPDLAGQQLIGQWFAPRSGRETRQAIQERGVELRDELETAADGARKRIEGESLDESIQAGKAQARRFQETTAHRR